MKYPLHISNTYHLNIEKMTLYSSKSVQRLLENYQQDKLLKEAPRLGIEASSSHYSTVG